MRSALLATLVLVIVLLAVGCAADYRPLIAAPSDSPRPPALLLRNVRVFTGRDAPVLVAQDVLVESGKIRSVGATGTLRPPPGTEVVAPRNATVLPGLIDTHVHVLASAAPPWHFRRPDAEHNLEAWLYAGVTTVVDMGGPPSDLDDLADDIAERDIAGPRIVHGDVPITAHGGHPIPAARALLPWPVSSIVVGSIPEVGNAEEAREAVADVKAHGSHWVKIIMDDLPPGTPKLSDEALRALVTEAHRAGLRAYVHVDTNADALAAVRAGADHLAHGVYEEPISDELVVELLRRKVTVTYTASGFVRTWQLAHGQWQPSALASATGSQDDEIEPVSGEAGKAFAEDDTLGPFAKSIAEPSIIRANVKKLFDAGVEVLGGSDSPVAGVLPGASLHEELRLFEEAGVSPGRALASVTSRAAAWLGEKDLGVVAPGKQADLLVVKGDPTRGLAALERIELVIQAGEIVHRLTPGGAD